MKDKTTTLSIRKVFLLAFFLVVAHATAFSQGSEIYGNGLRLKLDSTESKYLRFIFWNQIWMRNVEQNTNTVINGEEVKHTWDVGARRIRALAYAQISNRFLLLTHFGINNQTFSTGGGSGTMGTGGYGDGKKPQLFFHDVYGELAIMPYKDTFTGEPNSLSLYLGAGMHYWNGISRMTSSSTSNYLAIDAPVFNWPLVDLSDQFARQFGIYAKGSVNKLNYSMAVNKPFLTREEPQYHDLKGRVAVDNNGDPNLSFQGYFDYQFFEKENMTLPYRVGSYLGTKKVMNLGAGFYHTTDATKSIDDAGVVESHPINLFGVDFFADLPFGSQERRASFTAYAVYYHYDLGPNYFRTLGVMNTATGFVEGTAGNTIQGAGNSRMLLGTGDIIYAQAGLLLPQSNKRNFMRLQPFAAYTHKRLEYLDQGGHHFDIGANIIIEGHHAKITSQYSLRPIYYERVGRHVVDGYKGEFRIQLQVFL